MEQSLERPEDLGTDGPAVVRRWLLELDLANRREEKWRDRARKVVKRYRDEEERESSKFNILWSNIEVEAPALYSQKPTPDVRRRYRDADKVGRTVSQVLERGAQYILDTQPFDDMMEAAVQDVLLPGRAFARARYTPTFSEGERERVPLYAYEGADGYVDAAGDPAEVEGFDELNQPYMLGDPTEELVFEDVEFELVHWDDFRMGPGRSWEMVPWLAFRHEFTYDQLVREFGADVAGKVRLSTPKEIDEAKSDGTHDESTLQALKTAEAWEIWDKDNREVVFVCKGLPERPLKRCDDPLGLQDFYPGPAPIYAIKTSGSMIPIPEFTMYQDQADELDIVTGRIDRLIKALKVRGAYDASAKGLAQILEADDTQLVAVENWAHLVDKGGIDGVISWVPIKQIAEVLVQLYAQRQALIQTIYEITGISDIFRGATDARETMGAQQMKAQFGSLRMRRRQGAVQRFIRDLIRIGCEIMAEHFDPQTLQIMTGIQVTDEMMQVLRSDPLRSFSIDIETDSTIAMESEQEKQLALEFLGALVKAVETFAPLVQGGYMPIDAARAIIMQTARKFKATRDVEEALESIGQNPMPQQQQGTEANQPDPAAMARVQVDAEQGMAKLELEVAKLKSAADLERLKLMLEERKIALDEAQLGHSMRTDAARIVLDSQRDQTRVMQ